MDDNQLLKLQYFLDEMRRQVSPGAYFHYGDLMWRMNFLANEFDESKDLKIWGKDNSIIGFVFDLVKENNPEIFIKPELYDSIYSNQMLDYAITNAKERKAKYIDTSCLKSDKVKEKFLLSKGFKKQNDIIVVMENPMTENFKEVLLPSNYTYIEPEVCDDYQNSLNWLTNKQLSEPSIDHCLSSIICFENKAIVSGSLCWYDVVANGGQFEPVETSNEHQKKGLAYIGMHNSLSKLKNKGAKKAYVKTGIENKKAILLYKKLGFTIIDEDYGWRMDL